MSNPFIGRVSMGGTSYGIGMASAVDQRSIMFKLGRSGLTEMVRQMALAEVGSSRADVVALAIVGKMIQVMPEEDFNFIADKLLERVYREGDNKQVTMEDFRGEMQSYVHLVVLALGVNFKDFSQLLTIFQKSFGSSGQEAEKKSEPTQTGSSGDPAQE